MRKFRFLGFRPGSPVSMSVQQGTRTRSASVQRWGMAGSVTISRQMASPALVAPAAIFLQADVAGLGVATSSEGYDPSAHDVEYIWSIALDGEPGYATETYDYVGDLPAEFRVKGTRYGKKIGHVMDRAGTYRFVVTAINIDTGDAVTSDEHTVTIADPDDYFGPLETIYVAPPQEGNDVPAPNGGVFTTLTLAREQIERNPAGTGRYRVRVKRGFTYDQGFSCPRDGSSCVTWMLDAWGTGAKPVLTGSITTGRNDGQESVTGWHIRDVDVVRTQEGTTVDTGYLNNNRVGAIWNVRCEGVPTKPTNAPYSVISPGDGTGWLAMANSRFLKLHGLWGLRSIGNAACVVGCVYEDDPDAPASHAEPDDKREGYGVRWGGDAWLTAFSQCRFFKRTGWFDNVTSIQTTHQIFRLGNGDRLGQYIHIERSLLEGSWKVVNLTEGDGALGNVVVERNLMYGVHDTNGAVATKFSGITVRNNLFVRPPSQPAQGATNDNFLLNQFFGFSGALSDGERAAPARVYSNTIIILGDVADDFSLVGNGGSGLTALEVANNVVHHPYTTSIPPVDAGPFTLTALYETLYKGYWDTETPTGNITEPAEYLVSGNARVGTFLPGETVVGSVSGSSRVYTRDHPIFGPDKMAFETPLINTGPITTNRFVAGETLTGQTSGATAVVGNTVQQGTLDTGLYDTLLIPRTVTPTHRAGYSGRVTAFTEGATLTSGNGSATITQITDLGNGSGILWLRDVSGDFAVGDILADSAGGSAVCAEALGISGVGALWLPAEGSDALGAALEDPVAITDFFGNRRPPYPSKGAFEAGF